MAAESEIIVEETRDSKTKRPQENSLIESQASEHDFICTGSTLLVGQHLVVARHATARSYHFIA